MHTANWALDIAILLLAISLAGMLRQRFFYVALLLTIVLGFLRLHYGLHYSWTFVGKIAVDFAVPLAMGWAGVHLAAEVKDHKERTLWQAVFALLAIFGLVVGFLVERQLDMDHKTEMGDLRSGIRTDMTTALIEYNNAHPQHQVTIEQFKEITKGLTAPTASRSDEDEFANISNPRLEEMARDTAAQIKDFDERWYKARENQWLILDDLLHHDLTPQEKQQALKDYQTGLQSIANNYWFGLSGRNLFITADKLRKAIVGGRLSPWQKNTADTTNGTQLKYLLSLTVAPDLDEKGIQETPEYLNFLARRLKEK